MFNRLRDSFFPYIDIKKFNRLRVSYFSCTDAKNLNTSIQTEYIKSP